MPLQVHWVCELFSALVMNAWSFVFGVSSHMILLILLSGESFLIASQVIVQLTFNQVLVTNKIVIVMNTSFIFVKVARLHCLILKLVTIIPETFMHNSLMLLQDSLS